VGADFCGGTASLWREKLPEFARGLGSSIREFQEALRGEKKTTPSEKSPKASEALDKTLDG
jgi:Sec-independent protein translocase protein TatA